MKLRIGAYDIPLRFMDEDEEDYGDLWGSFSLHDGIEIMPEQSPSMMASTILHEAIHAIWTVYGLPPKVSEEEACERLEGPLLAFLRDNQGPLEVLLDATRGVPIDLTEATRGDCLLPTG